MTSSDNTSTRRDVLKTGGVALGAATTASLIGQPNEAHAQTVNINAMAPTPEQMQAFLALPPGPVVMVNLLKFKADGGAEEYSKYGQKIRPILQSIGAKLLFSGDAKVCFLGNGDWDSVALVEYPDKTALIKMSQSPEYQAIHHHRAAGLEGQVNYAVVQTNSI